MSNVAETTTMGFDDWETKFRPIKNHICVHAAVDGLLFETFGKEWDFVVARNASHPGTVWTVMKDDDTSSDEAEDEFGEPPGWTLVDGVHWVNRIGYLITEVPFEYSETQRGLNVSYD